MNNVVGQAVMGADLYGRSRELEALWASLERGEHVHMLAPRRVGKTSLMLELRRRPRPGWHVAYVDVEAAVTPADCVAAVMAELAATPTYRSWLEALPLGRRVAAFWRRVQSAELSAPFLRVEFRSAIQDDWPAAMDGLQSRLASLPDNDAHLLIVVDELPVLVARMLRQDGGHDQVELLLAKLRGWRQSPALRGKVRTLVAGSIGLEGILRREALSTLINDFVPFRLGSWTRTTAAEFLKELGRSNAFRLADESIGRILDLLGDPVPYHIQLFFHELHVQAGGDVSVVTTRHIDECFANTLTGASGTSHLDHHGTRLETTLDADSYAAAQTILGLACAVEGVALHDVLAAADGQEGIFRTVLEELEFDGYLDRQDERLVFRSNLLRSWWRKHRTAEVR